MIESKDGKKLFVKESKMLVPALMVGMCLITEASARSVDYEISNPAVGSATESGYADLQVVNYSIDNNVNNGALAGGIEITENGTATPGVPTSYTTICTDVEGTLYLGKTYQYNSPTTFLNPTQTGIAPTWGADNGPGVNVVNAANAAQAIQNAAYLFYTFGQLTSGGINGTADQMAGLQLAVWEALYDTTDSGKVVVTTSGADSPVSDGSRFQVLAGGDVVAVADAASYISSLDSQLNAGDFGYAGNLLCPTPGSGLNVNADGEPPQELLIDPPAVPEPSTIIAGMAVLVPAGAATFRGLRKKLKA